MWKDAYLESRVLAADPVELIHILYEHALEEVQDARRYLATGDIAARSHCISRVIAVLTELDASLDRQTGGSIGRNLAELYQYMRTRLLSANIQQQDAPLAEVESLLRTLGEAWSAIRSGGSAAPAPQTGHTEERWAGASFTPEPEYAAQAWSA